MSKKTRLQEIAFTLKEHSRAEKPRNPLWGKSGYLMGTTELRELFSTMKHEPPRFPPGATREEKIQILKQRIEAFKILSEEATNWPEESSYFGNPVPYK